MSYNQYSGYGGNPYGSDGQAGGYGQSNPYQSDAGNPYGGGYGQVSSVEVESGDARGKLTAAMRSTMEDSNSHL
jgi:hypothetical protein